jgi:hypothetical protein
MAALVAVEDEAVVCFFCSLLRSVHTRSNSFSLLFDPQVEVVSTIVATTTIIHLSSPPARNPPTQNLHPLLLQPLARPRINSLQINPFNLSKKELP